MKVKHTQLLKLKGNFICINILLLCIICVLIYYIFFSISNIFTFENTRKEHSLLMEKYKIIKDENEEYKYTVDVLYNNASPDQLDKYLKKTMIYLKKNEKVLDITDLE